MKPRRLPSIDRPWLVATLAAAVMIAVLMLIGSFNATSNSAFFCRSKVVDRGIMPVQLHSILHYATTRAVPQQSAREVHVTFDVLFSIYPCNFLVFGLGHDSLMWASLNPNGFTMFLEEDPNWVRTILTKAPNIRVHSVEYKTHVYDAKNLLAHYKTEPTCLPPKLFLNGNTKCRLVLSDLPNEIYSKEWDVIMIDGPRGYQPELPGRMAAIYTAAVMARLRTRPGVTHVILHDVNRRVERVYAEKFLCKKHLVKGVERLWHFAIPSATKEDTKKVNTFFC
ncbi:hypothetical protein Cgig2_003081 [Carnegiea gigantea]|uniref:Polysaccharide biosynthesis domain-containing protein n=1 Tax=Carnegiea gigantea TaxID=171969 RepID=A0A9Q1KDL9_9CARY|nr:hypothetical protein Cgig2_003081 [Carnegiea gigantea]